MILKKKIYILEDDQNYPASFFFSNSEITNSHSGVINVIGLAEAKAERDERQKPVERWIIICRATLYPIDSC